MGIVRAAHTEKKAVKRLLRNLAPAAAVQ